MEISRMAYIVYFKGKNMIRRIKRLPVNIAYNSKKLNYLVFYGDLDQEKYYYNQIKRVRGFIKLEKSNLYLEHLNFNINEI